MASRTRNRVLGIVVLLLAAAVTILVILLSQSGDGPPVTPLREDKAKHEQRNDREEDAGPSAGWFATPAPLSSESQVRRAARKRSQLRARRRKRSERHNRPTAKPVKKRERTRRARSRDPRPPRDRAPSPPPFAGPVPVSAPASPPAPAVAADPAPSQPTGTSPKNEPKTEALEARPVEIEIEDGDLEDELDVQPSGGQLRLRVRSDQLVLVEVEGRELSRLIPAGGDELIEFPSTKSYDVELRRRKGVLVLRLSD